MTIFIVDADVRHTPSVGSALLNVGDILYLLDNVTISSESDTVPSLTCDAGSQSVYIDGRMFGFVAIEFSASVGTAFIGATGSVTGASQALLFRADGGEVHNDGQISGSFTAIRSETGTLDVFNTGTISGSGFGILAVGTLGLVNSGTIISRGSAVVGGSGNDRVTNTGQIQGAVFLGAGNDTYDGTGGIVTDTIALSSGDDTCTGGAGTERIGDGTGLDEIAGGGGDDSVRLEADGTDDTFDGEAGRDTLDFRSDSDATANLAAGYGFGTTTGAVWISGVEVLIGSAGADRFTGDDGTNTLTGLDGNDFLSGGLGDDRLLGGFGNDRGFGGDGNDRLVGNGGLDTLSGGNGDDVIAGDLDIDRLTGGSGVDRFVFRAQSDLQALAGTGPERITDFVAGTDLIDVSAMDARPTVPGAQPWVFTGGAASNAGQIGVRQVGANTFLDFIFVKGSQIETLRLDGLIALTAADFIL